jgi:protein-disulfide isomerase/uncharacterized membrane protein
MLRGRALVALVCLLAACALSGLLLLEHHGIGGAAAEAVCGDGSAGPSGCEEVARSPFSTLRGVPLAAIGLAFSAALAALAALSLVVSEETRRALLLAALAALGCALVVDVMLLGVQVFAIGRFCPLCLATYAANAAAFVALWPARSGARPALAALGAPEGRLALAGVATAAVLATGLTALADRGMAGVAARPGADPLGLRAPAVAPAAPAATIPPTTLAAPATSSPAVVDGSALARAEAEVARLRGILADPEKLNAYLEQQAREAFERSRAEKIDLAGVPFKGPESAPIKVVEYSDFLCPFCRSIAGALANYLPSSGNRVSIHFKHYPIDQECNPRLQGTLHRGACNIALAAVCAEEQGRFWPFHDRVFAAPPQNATRDDVVRIAVGAGLDPTALGACLDSPRAKQRLAADIAEAERLGVDATPTVFVNGKRLANLNLFLQAVDSESRRLGLPAAAGGQR